MADDAMSTGQTAVARAGDEPVARFWIFDFGRRTTFRAFLRLWCRFLLAHRFSGVSVHCGRVHEIGVRGELVARWVVFEDDVALDASFAHSKHDPSGIFEREIV